MCVPKLGTEFGVARIRLDKAPAITCLQSNTTDSGPSRATCNLDVAFVAPASAPEFLDRENMRLRRAPYWTYEDGGNMGDRVDAENQGTREPENQR